MRIASKGTQHAKRVLHAQATFAERAILERVALAFKDLTSVDPNNAEPGFEDAEESWGQPKTI